MYTLQRDKNKFCSKVCAEGAYGVLGLSSPECLNYDAKFEG